MGCRVRLEAIDCFFFFPDGKKGSPAGVVTIVQAVLLK